MPNTTTWILFNLFVIAMLALDLGFFHRKEHEVKAREALIWSAFWILLALLFNVLLYFWLGPKPAAEYLTGYLLEKSLSVDNLFVMLLIFSYFQIPGRYQHRVLFWGILGALVMRGILILIGAALIHRFEWILYLFGAFLVFTGLKMLFGKDDEEIEPERNPVLKLFKRFVPVTPEFHGKRFFVNINGQRFATPLMVALVVVEISDLIFAVDSIPAIFVVTQDPFIIYTSNVFAILGLRSLYFALAAIIDKFHYLKFALALILTFIGVKMLGKEFVHDLPVWVTLGIVAGTLLGAVVASVIWPPPPKSPEQREETLAEARKEGMHP